MDDVQLLASRTMVAQDANWLSKALYSAVEEDGVWSIALFGHAARVVFEGSKIVRDPDLGAPQLADLLNADFADVIARARQATKLLDDKNFPLPRLQSAMAESYRVHNQRFTGNAVWFARFLETDLAVGMLNGRVVAASIPMDRRFGLDVLDEPSVRGVGKALGGALAVLAALLGEPWDPNPVVDFRAIGAPAWRDRLAARYLGPAYEPDMPIETKLILLLAESEIATSVDVLPHTAGEFGVSVFRSQVVVLFHTLSSVLQITEAEQMRRAVSREVVAFLQQPRTKYFLEDAGFRQLRNYSVHYGIRDPKLKLDLSAPMFGLVERLTGRSAADLAQDVIECSVALADLLAEWRQTSG